MEAIEDRVNGLEAALQRFIERTDLRIAAAERMIERVDRDIAQSHRMVDRLDQSLAEMKEESRQNTLNWARIADRVGRFAEDIVAPNIPRIAQEVFGISEVEVEALRVKRRHSRDASRLREFDVVLAGNRHLLVTSVKSTARESDIREFAGVLKEIFDYFPEFRGYAVLPIFASMTLSTDLVRRLTRSKIYALALGQRTMELLNLVQLRTRPANGKSK